MCPRPWEHFIVPTPETLTSHHTCKRRLAAAFCGRKPIKHYYSSYRAVNHFSSGSPNLAEQLHMQITNKEGQSRGSFAQNLRDTSITAELSAARNTQIHRCRHMVNSFVLVFLLFNIVLSIVLASAAALWLMRYLMMAIVVSRPSLRHNAR